MRYALSTILLAAATTASAQTICPSGSDDVRITALSALMQVESEQVLPTLKKVLERRDVCSIQLRKQTISMLTRRQFGDQTETYLNVARTDASEEVRRYAIQHLARANNERSTAILDSIINRSDELESRDVALRALAQSTAPNARQSVRNVAENDRLPMEIRSRAVYALANSRREPGDAAWLIALHGKVQQQDLREQVMRAVATQRNAESTNWLLGIARDKGRDLETRRQALYHTGNAIRANDSGTSAGIDLPRLLALYEDFSGQIEMQDRAIDMISQRPESAATDKLLDIARNEKNVELRRKAMLRVGQRRDPRVREFLLEVLGHQ